MGALAKLRFICLGVAAAMGTAGPFASAAPRIQVGQPYPHVVLPRLKDRSAVSLADFRGKKVLLIQFASW